MRLFICGEYARDYIEEVLDAIDEDNYIEEISINARNECSSYVIDWAEELEVPINVYLPEFNNQRDTIKLNNKIIRENKPDAIFIYKEPNKAIRRMLLKEAEINPAVNSVISNDMD